MLSWNYSDEDAWAQLEGCCSGKGHRQSPIDIQSKAVISSASLVPLVLTGWGVPLAGGCHNNGKTIMFTPSGESASGRPAFQNHKGNYVLKQFHIHWGRKIGEGAEHSVDGNYHDAELHFVHLKEGTSPSSNDKDAYAVLGIFLKASETGSENTWNQLLIPIEFNQTISVPDLKCADFLPESLDYYHYEGSLTTPPCTEVVQWFLLKSPISVPQAYLCKLQQMKTNEGTQLLHNFRSIQPLNERVVMMPIPPEQ